LGVIHTLLGV